jgi:hypothetical protein
MLKAGRSQDQVPTKALNLFNLHNPFQPHYGPRVDSASNINEYQKMIPWSRG